MPSGPAKPVPLVAEVASSIVLTLFLPLPPLTSLLRTLSRPLAPQILNAFRCIIL